METTKADEHLKEASKLMADFASHHGVGMHKVYTSLIDYMAGFLDIQGRPVHGWSFNKSQNKEFARMTEQLCLATECGIRTKGWMDVFGEFFMRYLAEKNRMGQCFSPESLSELASMIVTDGITEQGQCRCGTFGMKHIVSDPACGSGRLVLAAITHLQIRKGLKCYAICEDNDEICVKQTALNLAMHGYYGEVICHNSLSEPDTVKFGYIVNEGCYPFPDGIPTLRWSENPDEYVCTRFWKERRNDKESDRKHIE